MLLTQPQNGVVLDDFSPTLHLIRWHILLALLSELLESPCFSLPQQPVPQSPSLLSSYVIVAKTAELVSFDLTAVSFCQNKQIHPVRI